MGSWFGLESEELELGEDEDEDENEDEDEDEEGETMGVFRGFPWLVCSLVLVWSLV